MINAESIARTIAYDLDGEYHDGIGVDVNAHVSANPAEVWIKTTSDDGEVREFRVTVEQQP